MHGAGNAALRSKAANQLAIYIVIQLYGMKFLSTIKFQLIMRSCIPLFMSITPPYIALTVVWAWVSKCGPYIYNYNYMYKLYR